MGEDSSSRDARNCKENRRQPGCRNRQTRKWRIRRRGIRHNSNGGEQQNLRIEIKEIPKSVNSEENSRVKTGMVNDLSFTHPQGLRHPVQESQVSPKIEIDKLAHKIPRAPRAGSGSRDVPFREIDPVVDGLNPEESKGQQEGKCAENVDES